LNKISLVRPGTVSGIELEKWGDTTILQDVYYQVYKITTNGYKSFIFLPSRFIGGGIQDEDMGMDDYPTYTFNGHELEIITENFQIE